MGPLFAPHVQVEPSGTQDSNAVADIKKIDAFKRQVLLDARVVTMERGDLLNLGVEWSWPKISAGTFTEYAGTVDSAGNPIIRSGWPYGVQIGYTPDRLFTDSLMMTLNLLRRTARRTSSPTRKSWPRTAARRK